MATHKRLSDAYFQLSFTSVSTCNYGNPFFFAKLYLLLNSDFFHPVFHGNQTRLVVHRIAVYMHKFNWLNYLLATGNYV
jgi:hypothetical protein